MNLSNVVVLCPHESVSLEPLAAMRDDVETAFSMAEDAVEEMVVCLAAIEASWATGEFSRLNGLLKTLSHQAEQTGLPDVVHITAELAGLLDGRDEVAMAAVVSRLVRVCETSLATLLEMSYLQI